MATVTAEFALALEDGISASSESAKDALQSLQAQIDKDSKALTQMKKAMRQIQAGSSVDVAAYRKLKGEIDATQNSIGKARSSFINLGGDFSKTGKKAKKVKFEPSVGKPKGFNEMLSATESLPGPLAKASKGVSGVRSMIAGFVGAVGLGTAAVLGIIAALAALVVVLAAVAAATAKATIELLKYAAAQADAVRSERLRLQGLGTIRRWMRLTAKDSEQMSESIDRVSESVPLARSQIAGYAQELHRLGIRGRGAEYALEALSLAQAVQGDFGRQRLMRLVRGAGHSEEAMRNLAERVRKELGGIAGGQMRALGMIAMKLKESFQALFKGVNITPLLDGLFELSDLFKQSTQTGRALKEIMEVLLEPLIDEIGTALPSLQGMFEQLVIWALEIAIVVMDVRIAIRRAFGSNILKRITKMVLSANNVRVVLIALSLVVAVLAAGVVFLGLVVIGLLTPFLLVAWAMYRGYQEIRRLHSAILGLRKFFEPSWWAAAGRSIIDGIITGLRSGVARLGNAVREVASGAMGSFREALGIHSPSAVFAQFGLAIPQGVAEGVERGSSEAIGAVGNMVSTTTSNVSAVGAASSQSINIGEINLHLGEGEGSEDTARRVTDALRDFFENGLAAEPV